MHNKKSQKAKKVK